MTRIRAGSVVDHIVATLQAAGIPPDPDQIDAIAAVSTTDPNALRATVASVLPESSRVVVTGTLDRRLLALSTPKSPEWTIADLTGEPHATRAWPDWVRTEIHLHRPEEWLSPAHLTAQAVHRLTRSRVLLAALYHPENFPLPRFPLSISDLARAARATLCGQVRLMDMQLDTSLADIVAAVSTEHFDNLGVSATFGQHDLLTHLLDTVAERENPPLVIAGGSLTVRNERMLLERYPHLLIARGAGEPTIADLLAYWHHDLELEQVRGLGYAGAPYGSGTLALSRRRRTASTPNRATTDFFPELDLLDATFAHRGVAQLETSRGCTNTCSFCPRGHKGTWFGSTPRQLPWILDAMGDVFDRHPEIARVLYLVDEEFIGRGIGAVERALAVADTLHAAGFRWETSCRIDQVVQPNLDRGWHIDRVCLWRRLLSLGLRRCLFGIESGVTSILERFHKETTGGQNAHAIRTLSALGIPTRYTYITFDQLMTAEELRASYTFQGRRDLLLRPLPHLNAEDIVDGVRDPAFIAAHATGQPFYTAISYMLVVMEPLIGAAYTQRLKTAGLTRTPRPSMGRIDADFADWRIGICADGAQLWIDRHLAFDYALKSLEKILDGPPRERTRSARVVLKKAAFDLLGAMLNLIDTHSLDEPSQAPMMRGALLAVMDQHMDRLRIAVANTVQELRSTLPGHTARILNHEHRRWSDTGGWRLINAANACAT
ncbi:hypothetical protein GCM10012275_30370 [Longimycelium tulufanense]|uniref:B12-binding domain-containing protein n=1 Tax=Longimycelium tulufanense TaxID=907463 RepID=A0A8J3CEK7_9PSEU|nr:radical SAM protein [Longimycelium tulufanense]GGM57189.1 hypothetical protein GCM10012275_30370 [Longimycelium tulufanense]